jgi:putative Holliday junction resolvase
MIAKEGRLLGLDLGSRRIGVAVSDSARNVATGVSIVTRSGDRTQDHAAIAELVDEYGAVGVVVGMPYSLSGETGPAAASVLAEVEALRRRLGVDVETIDERFTTVSAAAFLRAGGRRGRQARAVIDQTAAATLLQTWLDRAARTGAPR